jgi:hypothetical protein
LVQIKNKFKKDEGKIDLILNNLDEENNKYNVEWFEKKYNIKIFNNN